MTKRQDPVPETPDPDSQEITAQEDGDEIIVDGGVGIDLRNGKGGSAHIKKMTVRNGGTGIIL